MAERDMDHEQVKGKRSRKHHKATSNRRFRRIAKYNITKGAYSNAPSSVRETYDCPWMIA